MPNELKEPDEIWVLKPGYPGTPGIRDNAKDLVVKKETSAK